MGTASVDKQSAAGVPSRVMTPLRRLRHLCHPFTTGRQKKERKEELRPCVCIKAAVRRHQADTPAPALCPL